MPKTRDYYDYWNKKRQGEYHLLDREKKSIRLIIPVVKGRSANFVDLGCGNGEFIRVLQRLDPSLKIKGLDYSKAEVKEAKKKGLNVKQANFEYKLKIKDSSCDFVYAGEMIEHLYDPDFFLSEINRVTKKGGYILITTPNLLAWFNRILFPAGIQPLFLEPSTKSKLVGAGLLKSLKKESQPVGHVRIFTLAAMKDLFRMNGFEVIKVAGAIYDNGLPRWLWPMDRFFTNFDNLASGMLVLGRKVR